MKNIPVIAALCFGLLACTDDGAPADPIIEATGFRISVEGIAPAYPYFASGSFTIPVGAAASGPLLPGDSYSVEFHAPPGTRLSFATMFLSSNDLFFAPGVDGLELFDAQGLPLSGELTDQIELWDAGTELDQELGLGDQQGASQTNPNLGDADPNPNVRLASESYPDLPAVADLIGVTLSAGAGNMFTLTLENRSTDQTLMLSNGTTSSVPLSPGVFVIHSEAEPLFVVGNTQRAAGLEALAEDGDPTELTAVLAENSGVVSPLAPGLWVIHGESDQGELYQLGEPDYGNGLETLAEDGDPVDLLAYYGDQANPPAIGIFGGVYGDDVMPLLPGGAFIFDIEARPGDRISIASMFGQSNDMFLATAPEGIALFDGDGAPIAGDISAEFSMLDAGTEVNEYLGAGPNQAPRQAAPNSGADEGGVVQLAAAGSIPEAITLVRVMISAN
jgi:hypothetical protein